MTLDSEHLQDLKKPQHDHKETLIGTCEPNKIKKN